MSREVTARVITGLLVMFGVVGRAVPTVSAQPPECAPCEFAIIIAQDGAADDRLGCDIARDADRIVVGACGDDHQDAIQAGSAYVFRREGIEWVQEAKLTASDGLPADQFGQGVAIQGDRIVVGAPQHWLNGHGAAYIFKCENEVWFEECKLTAFDGAPYDLFGWSVAMGGDRIVVGAHADADAGHKSGSAYVFRFEDETWVLEAKLTASDAQAEARFGRKVDIDGDRLVVSAYWGDRSKAGWAYVFRREGVQWLQEAKLTAENPQPGDHFYHVAMEGDRVCVGADQRCGPGPGFVEVFRREGTDWIREARLTASDGVSGDCFCVPSIRGDRIVVGAYQMLTAKVGAAYLFHHQGADWVEVAKLTASDAAQGDQFGCAVSLEGASVAIGAWQCQTAQPGKAYMFAIDGEDCSLNGVLDWCDIYSGESDDDGNGVPDECEPGRSERRQIH